MDSEVFDCFGYAFEGVGLDPTIPVHSAEVANQIMD